MAKKKLFDNKTDYLVLLFIVGVALMLSFCEARADFSIEELHDSNAKSTTWNSGWDRICGRYHWEQGTSIAICPVVAVGGDIGDGAELEFAEEFRDGRYEFGIRLSYFEEDMSGGLTFRRMIGDGPFQLGLGGSYWIDESPGSNSDFTFNLGIRYKF